MRKHTRRYDEMMSSYSGDAAKRYEDTIMGSNHLTSRNERDGTPHEPQTQHAESKAAHSSQSINDKLDEEVARPEKDISHSRPRTRSNSVRGPSLPRTSAKDSNSSPFMDAVSTSISAYSKITQYVFRKQYSRAEPLEQENKEPKFMIDDLRADRRRYHDEFNELKGFYDQSQMDLAILKENYDNLYREAQAYEESWKKEAGSAAKERDEMKATNQLLESRIEALQENNKKLRGIILSKSKEKGGEIDEATVTAAFTHLRDLIQRVVQKFYYFNPNQPPRYMQGIQKDFKDFFDYWAGIRTEEELAMRARAMLFQIINDYILNVPQFGLQSRSFSEIEAQLANFEKTLMTHAPNNEKEIVEWRVNTVKCASLLNCDQPQALHLAMSIWDHMKRFGLQEHILNTDYKNQLIGLLQEICDKAAKFALLIRTSKDSYKCEAPRVGTELSEAEMSVQYQEQEQRGSTEDTDVVSFVISGALVKYPEYSVNERLILEKAYVVTCQRPSFE